MFIQVSNYYSNNLKWQYSGQIETYEDIVKEIFMNSTIEYSSNEDFKRCLKEEKKFPIEKHIETSKRVKDIALNMVQSDSISEALVYAQQIADNYLDVRDTLLDYNDFYSKINEYCYWGKEDLLDFNADLNEDIKYFIENVQNAEESMVKAYEQLVQLKLPILTTYNVYNLQIVKSVKDVNDVCMQEIVESLKHGLDPGLVSLVKLTFQRILDSVKEVKEEIVKPMEDLMEEIQALRKSLREYEESTIIDSNFFM